MSRRIVCGVLAAALILAPGCGPIRDYDPDALYASQVGWAATLPLTVAIDLATWPVYVFLGPFEGRGLGSAFFPLTRIALAGMHCHAIDWETEVPDWPRLPGKPPDMKDPG